MTRLRDLVRLEPKRPAYLPAWLDRWISAGIVSTDPQIVRRQRCVNVGAALIAGNTLSHLVILSTYDFQGLVVIHVYNVIMGAAMVGLPLLHRFGANVGAVTGSLLVLFGNTFVVWSLGFTSDLQVYFTLAGVMLFFFGVQQWRLFLVFFLLFVVALLIVLNFAPVDGLILPDDGKLRDLLSSQAMINAITINAAILFYALTALQRAETELAGRSTNAPRR